MNIEKDAKERILQATAKLLEDTDDISTITVRRIAANAEVGTGLINYYFQSKENLIGILIGKKMEDRLTQVLAQHSDTMNPTDKLRQVLKDLCDIGQKYEPLVVQMLQQMLSTGNLQAEISLIPLLRDIYGSRYDDFKLRMLALQIIAPMQAAIVSVHNFQIYSGFNLDDKKQRDLFIDQLIDSMPA